MRFDRPGHFSPSGLTYFLSIVVARGAVQQNWPPSVDSLMRAGEVTLSAGKYHDSAREREIEAVTAFCGDQDVLPKTGGARKR